MTLVATNPLENSKTVVKGVGEDVDLGLVPVDQLSVHPYLLHLFNHRIVLLGP